jgi:ABC-type uncharacterized transport system permease subunit
MIVMDIFTTFMQNYGVLWFTKIFKNRVLNNKIKFVYGSDTVHYRYFRQKKMLYHHHKCILFFIAVAIRAKILYCF